jgi:hypothetical protein
VYKDINDVFIFNFWCQELHHIAQNSGKDLCIEDVLLMISKRMVASDECMDIDDPIAQDNFTELLCKVMKEGSSTWDVIWFLCIIQIDRRNQRMRGPGRRLNNNRRQPLIDTRRGGLIPMMISKGGCVDWNIMSSIIMNVAGSFNCLWCLLF